MSQETEVLPPGEGFGDGDDGPDEGVAGRSSTATGGEGSGRQRPLRPVVMWATVVALCLVAGIVVGAVAKGRQTVVGPGAWVTVTAQETASTTITIPQRVDDEAVGGGDLSPGLLPVTEPIEGRYVAVRAPVADMCIWDRLKAGPSGGPSLLLIQGGQSSTSITVVILATDRAFFSHGCVWRRVA